MYACMYVYTNTHTHTHTQRKPQNNKGSRVVLYNQKAYEVENKTI